MITWAFEHVLREYMVQVEVIKNGKVVEVPALRDREKFRFTKLDKNEQLEFSEQTANCKIIRDIVPLFGRRIRCG